MKRRGLLSSMVVAAKRSISRSFLKHCRNRVQSDIEETEREMTLARDTSAVPAEIENLKARHTALMEELAYLDAKLAMITEDIVRDAIG